MFLKHNVKLCLNNKVPVLACITQYLLIEVGGKFIICQWKEKQSFFWQRCGMFYIIEWLLYACIFSPNMWARNWVIYFIKQCNCNLHSWPIKLPFGRSKKLKPFQSTILVFKYTALGRISWHFPIASDLHTW